MMNKNKDHEKKNKKPRLAWSEELHRKFVHAVNLLGIDNAVPRKILALMNDERLTKENVASHLQKYKLSLKRISSTCVPNENGSVIGSGQLQNVSPSDPVYQNGVVQEMLMSTWHSNQSPDSLIDDVLLQCWEDHNQDASDLSDFIGTSLNTVTPLKDVVDSNLGFIEDLVTVASSNCITQGSIEIGEQVWQHISTGIHYTVLHNLLLLYCKENKQNQFGCKISVIQVLYVELEFLGNYSFLQFPHSMIAASVVIHIKFATQASMIDTIDRCFCHDTVEEIIEALEVGECYDQWCLTTLRNVKEASPLSLNVILRSVSYISHEDCF